MEKIKIHQNGQWALEKSDSNTPRSSVESHLPDHISMHSKHKPGTPEYKKYVHAAHEWHDKVHRAIMKDNPHLKQSYGENLHPREHGYDGEIKSTKALDELHTKHKAEYSVKYGD